MVFGLAVSLIFVAVGLGILRLGIRTIRTREFVGKRRQENEIVPYRLSGDRAVLLGRSLVTGGIILVIVFGLANILTFSDTRTASYVICLSPLAVSIIFWGVARAHHGLDAEEDI